MEDYVWCNGKYMIKEYRGEFVKELFFFVIKSCRTGATLPVQPDTLEEAEEICRFFTDN